MRSYRTIQSAVVQEGDFLMIYMTWHDLDRLNVLRQDIKLEISALKNLHGKCGRPKSTLPAIREDLELKKALYDGELARTKQYLSEIDDDLIRAILTEHFVNGLPWWKVAWNVPGNFSRSNVQQKAQNYVYMRCQLQVVPRKEKMAYDA